MFLQAEFFFRYIQFLQVIDYFLLKPVLIRLDILCEIFQVGLDTFFDVQCPFFFKRFNLFQQVQYVDVPRTCLF